MPYVPTGEARDRSFADLRAIAEEMGPAPWRVCLVGTPGLRVVLVRWAPGYATVPHRHPRAEEIFTVVAGLARFAIGDEPEREVGPGELVLAMRGVEHAIRVPDDGPLTLLAAVAPNEDGLDETIETL